MRGFRRAAKRSLCLPQLGKSLHSNELGTTKKKKKKHVKLGRQTSSCPRAFEGRVLGL